jgi:hypothetical protein
VDLTDGREAGDWETRYTEKSARRQIRTEAAYLLLVLLACLTLIALIGLQGLGELNPAGIRTETYRVLAPYALAGLGGMVGGTLFAMKWLYHSVAKYTWNQDRWIWRTFTPILSGGVALIVFTLSASRVLPLFGAEIISSNSGALGVSLFVGYFSDKTLSRLERFATQHLDARGSDKDRGSTGNADSA